MVLTPHKERGHDIRALFNHDPNIVLGRTGTGILKLTIDRSGLHYEAEENMKAESVRNVVAYIERGDVNQSSFSFRATDDDWGTTGGDYPLRTLKRVRVFDLGPATLPAYEDTSSALRSLANITKRSLDDVVAAAGRDELRSLLLDPKTSDGGRSDPPINPEGVMLVKSRLSDWMGSKYGGRHT